MDQGTMLSSSEVCDLAGISYRQLDYWTRTGASPAENAGQPGSGNRRRWTPRQAAVLAVMAGFVQAGARPSELTEVVAYLMELPAHLWTGTLYVDPATRSVSRVPAGPAGQFVSLEGYDPGD